MLSDLSITTGGQLSRNLNGSAVPNQSNTSPPQPNEFGQNDVGALSDSRLLLHNILDEVLTGGDGEFDLDHPMMRYLMSKDDPWSACNLRFTAKAH